MTSRLPHLRKRARLLTWSWIMWKARRWQTTFAVPQDWGTFHPPPEIVKLFPSMALAADYPPQKGMFHPDLKPPKILLANHKRAPTHMGEPILTDFGLPGVRDA